MQKLTYILLSFSIFILSSCETLVENVDLPYQERLVITSFISPQDTIIEVKVSKTSPTVGKFPYDQSIDYNERNKYKPIEGVSIEMSDGQETVIVPLKEITYPEYISQDPKTPNKIVYATRKGYFLKTKDFPIVAGKTYNLTAKLANFPTVRASCTIPIKRLQSGDYQIIGGDKIDSVLIGTSYSGDKITARSYSLTKRFTILIKDFPSQENFYTVAYYTREIYQNKDSKGNVLPSNISINQQPYSDFISDYKRDGNLLEFKKATISVGYYSTDPNQSQYNSNTNSVSLLIYIAVIDKPYYQYIKSVANTGSVNNDDPFSEPVLTYTNIQNGLGVFAGYNTTAVEMKLK